MLRAGAIASLLRIADLLTLGQQDCDQKTKLNQII